MSRTNQILFLMFAGLLALFIFLERPWSSDRFTQAAERVSRPLFASFESDKAASIEIRHGSSEVKLEKTAAGWTLPILQGFKANPEAVSRLLDRIAGMRRSDLVTKDPARHTQYRVTSADAPHVVVRDGAGAVTADFYQGKPYFNVDEATRTSQISQLDCYIRAGGSDEVYRISPFETLEPVRVQEWLPRNLFKFDVPSVQSITIEGTDLKEPVALNRLPDGSWRVATPGGDSAGSVESCDTLARSISSIYLNDVVAAYSEADASRFGFDAPRIRVKVHLTGGNDEELIIGRDVEGSSPESTTAYALGGVARSHVSKVFVSSLAALRVTRDQLMPPASQPASQPDSQPAEAGSKPAGGGK